MPPETASPSVASDQAVAVRWISRAVDDVGRIAAVLTGKGRIDLTMLGNAFGAIGEAAKQGVSDRLEGVSALLSMMEMGEGLDE